MDLAKIQYFEKIESTQQQDFFNAHNNCILCGTALELQHIRVQNSSDIQEEASCPQCEVKTRTKVYILN